MLKAQKLFSKMNGWITRHDRSHSAEPAATAPAMKAALIILDFDGSPLNPQVSYPFAHGKPFISVAIAGQVHLHSASMGNNLSPAYTPYAGEHFEMPMSFPTRFINCIMFNIYPLMRYLVFFIPVQIQVRIFERNQIQ